MVEWSPHLAAIGQVFLLLFYSDSRIVSHLPLLDNWQIKLLDSVLVTTHFLSSTCGTSDIRISCNSLELNLAQCMHVVFCVRGWAQIVRWNKMVYLFLFWFLQQSSRIQREAIVDTSFCTSEPSFLNDDITQRFRGGLGPNLISL